MCVHNHLHAILTACNSRHLARACQHPGQLPEPPRAYCGSLGSHCFPASAPYCAKPVRDVSPSCYSTIRDPAYLWSQLKLGLSLPKVLTKVPATGSGDLKIWAPPVFQLITLPPACVLAARSHSPTCMTPEHPSFFLNPLLLAQNTVPLL